MLAMVPSSVLPNPAGLGQRTAAGGTFKDQPDLGTTMTRPTAGTGLQRLHSQIHLRRSQLDQTRQTADVGQALPDRVP